MRWLFAVFVVSLCALLWAAISVARHIHRDRAQLPAETGSVEADENGTGSDRKLAGVETGDEDK
jgi:hypothetical protein